VQKLILVLVRFFFGWIFRATKEDSKNASELLVKGARALSSLGGKRLRDFLVAMPLFMLFIRELVVQREKLGSKHELLIVGAGAALGTLMTAVTVSILTSLPFQFMLLVAHPIFGVSLIASSTLLITSIVVLMVWLNMHLLNSVFEENEIFISIKNSFIPSREQALLTEIGDAVLSSGVDVAMLESVAEAGLITRGGVCEPIPVIDILTDRAARGGFTKLKEAQVKDEIKEKMRNRSKDARKKAFARVKGRGPDFGA
tara:strand:- start:3188 stop:3958 length:771 start_codon:yes stop_codon:yes gene_type:complete